MAVLIRHISAVLVAIAVIAAQMMPAWAGCHSQRNAALTIISASAQSETAATMPDHHGMTKTTNFATTAMSSVAPDQAKPASSEVCLGNCGCACGLSGAFVLAGTMAINALHGVVQTPVFTSIDLPLGDRPDGPRRPPRTAA